jgi:hypothetical protein
VNAEQIRYNLIRPVLTAMGEATPCKHSDAAENLLMGTWAHESAGGKFIKQVGGPACGIFQIEPPTAHSIINNYVLHRKPFKDFLAKYTTEQTIEEQLITNLAFQVIIARLVYFPKTQPLPNANDIRELANYYKAHYNTPLGKGTADKFVDDYARYVR